MGFVVKILSECGHRRVGQVNGVSLQRSLTIDKCQLNLKFVAGQPFIIELNYHYAVTTATEAIKIMKDTYVSNYKDGLKLLSDVYSLDLEEEDAS